MMTMIIAAMIALDGGLSAGTAFDCRIGRDRAVIVADSISLRYTFGPPRRPAIEIVRPVTSTDVGYRYTLFPRAEHRHLRVSNGRYAYVAYSRFHAPDARGRGAEDRAGVLVLKDGVVVRRLRCDTGGFGDYAVEWLKVDRDDLAVLAEHG